MKGNIKINFKAEKWSRYNFENSGEEPFWMIPEFGAQDAEYKLKNGCMEHLNFWMCNTVTEGKSGLDKDGKWIGRDYRDTKRLQLTKVLKCKISMDKTIEKKSGNLKK